MKHISKYISDYEFSVCLHVTVEARDNYKDTAQNVSHYHLIFYFSFTDLRRSGILSRISSKTLPKTMDNVEDKFSVIEFTSLVPLFTALAAGFLAAIIILIGEIMLKYVLRKMRSCTLRITK
jgi:hypothetical protein